MTLTKTTELMRRLANEKTFDSYAVIVGHKGEEAVITSDNVNMDTYFDIASMGKVLVTATLILKKVGEGVLSLDDTLDMFFENVPEDKRKITIKQLLTHSSGILRRQMSAEVASHNNDYIAAWTLAQPLGYTPGTSYTYSCSGYLLLGYIVEKLYGATLDEAFYVHEKAPLGLKRARFNIALDEPNAAICYRWNDNRLRVMDDEIVSVLRGGVAGNGGEFWSPDDIRTYVRLVMEKSELLYNKELYKLAEHDHNLGADGVPFGGEGRGLGWLMVDERYAQTGRLFPKGSFGHCGHCGQSIFMNRELDLYVIILTNATRFANMNNDFKGYDYGKICKMREIIHNEIAEDLSGMLSL